MAPEIFAHAQRIAKHVRALRQRAVLHRGHRARVGRRPRRAGSSAPTAATRSAPGSSPWAPVRCTGPKLPGIPGIETFGGHCFHTSRWDYDYTGGDPAGAPMTNLGRQARRHHRHRRDRGAVHPAARRATRRSSSSSSARRRRSTSATTTRSTPSGSPTLEPGWQQEWLMNFATLQTGGFADEDLVKDGWTDISQRIRDRVDRRHGRGRRRVRRPSRRSQRPTRTATTRRWRRSGPGSTPSSHDPATAEALKPWYRQLCKRPCFHDEYLQAYNEPNVPPRRHRRQGRRAHRRDRRVGRRRALRARLPDLRLGLRGRHRATPAASGYETIGRDG